jgi:transposase InsO family protein
VSAAARSASTARWARKATASTTPSPSRSSPRSRRDLLRRRSFATRQDARTAVFDDIETFYNPVKLHSTLDDLSPLEYEKMKERETEKSR